MKREKRKYFIGGLLLLAGATLFYQKVFLPKRAYKTVNPVRGSIDLKVSGIGEVTAKSIYSISSQGGGLLTAVYRDQGEWVKKGELLALIDPVDLDEKLAEMKAAFGKALLEIETAEKEHALSEEQYKLTLQTFRRYDRLYQKKQVAEIEYDRARTDMLTSKTRMESNAYRIRSARAEAKRLRQAVKGIEAKLEILEIRSPVEGYVIAREAEPSEAVMPSQPILKIVDAKTLWIRAYIDERQSGKITKGQSAGITLRSTPGRAYAGYVARIDAVSDAVTEERIVYVAFHKRPDIFFINEQADVDIHIETLSDVIKFPSSLLVNHEGKKGVWIAKDRKVHFKGLHIVAQNDEEIAVASTLGEESRIIVPDANKLKLREGMRIHL